jgi:hypothetical protein
MSDIGKYYIIEHQDGWCLAEFDHSKFPSKEIPGSGGCWDGPDAWTESPDPLDPDEPALLFDTEADAQAIIDLIEADPINAPDETGWCVEYYILQVQAPIVKTISLSQEQLKSVISTLECTLNRQSRYGSFGDDDTIFDVYAIRKIINQLR